MYLAIRTVLINKRRECFIITIIFSIVMAQLFSISGIVLAKIKNNLDDPSNDGENLAHAITYVNQIT